MLCSTSFRQMSCSCVECWFNVLGSMKKKVLKQQNTLDRQGAGDIGARRSASVTNVEEALRRLSLVQEHQTVIRCIALHRICASLHAAKSPRPYPTRAPRGKAMPKSTKRRETCPKRAGGG